MNVKQPWWENGIIYQIYPRSFQDSNNDGIGDLKGIQSRLPYLQDLGITAIWLSPMYPSPMVDFGYDVSYYTDIDPLLGTVQDFTEFLEDAQQRGLKVILDFVPNHTSDQHRWFLYERLMSYYGDNLDECHLPFNFGLLTCPFQAESIIALINEYESLLPKGAWPNWVLGNHDKDRIASENRAGEANARLAQMLLLTLRGTPTMYYGDELGMPNGDIPPEKFQDPAALNELGIGQSRDFARTPMQWDETLYAGFSQVNPWLPVSGDFGSRNAASQEATPRSFLQMVKQLIAIRQSSPALNHGRYSSVPVGIRDIMAYLRIQGDVKILVVLNFSDEEKLVDLSSTAGNGKVMLSTTMDRNGDLSLQTLKLRQHEGLMIQLI